MFEPTNFDDAIAAAQRITTETIHDIFDGHVGAGLLSRPACDAICKELDPLLSLIKGPLRGEPFWQAFQRQFGFATPERVTPMNAANLCPEPTALIRAANLLRIAYNDNVAQQTRTAGGLRVEQIQRTRRSIAASLNIADPNDLALVRNSSEANNAISCGYRDWRVTNKPKELDTVVVWGQNHPTNLEAWRLRRDWHARSRPSNDDGRAGDPFRLIVVDFKPDDPDDKILEAFTRAIDEKTRFVSYTETTNGSGFRLPDSVISGIWKHVQDKPYDNCHVHVDGTMSWGARPVNLATPYCHSFVSSAHKWFMGPKETAVFYMAKEKAKNFSPSIFAYDYKIEIGNWDELPASALRFELIGQRDDVNLITLEMTQLMWTALAIHKPYERVAQLGELLVDLLQQSRWTLVTPSAATRRWGIVRVAAPTEIPTNSLYGWMYDQNRKHRIGGSGGSEKNPLEHTFRLCPHIYNTEQDIRNAVDGMNEWRKRHGASPTGCS